MIQSKNIPFISKNIEDALRSNKTLIVAESGFGKTFLTNAATSEEHRACFDGVWGHDARVLPGVLPELLERLDRFHGKKMAWLTVILGQCNFEGMPAHDWDKKAQWLQLNLQTNGSLDEFLELHQPDDKAVFLFNDLDALSDDPDERYQWKSELIEVAEKFRLNEHIQVKIFTRPGVWSDMRKEPKDEVDEVQAPLMSP